MSDTSISTIKLHTKIEIQMNLIIRLSCILAVKQELYRRIIWRFYQESFIPFVFILSYSASTEERNIFPPKIWWSLCAQNRVFLLLEQVQLILLSLEKLGKKGINYFVKILSGSFRLLKIHS